MLIAELHEQYWQFVFTKAYRDIIERTINDYRQLDVN